MNDKPRLKNRQPRFFRMIEIKPYDMKQELHYSRPKDKSEIADIRDILFGVGLFVIVGVFIYYLAFEDMIQTY
tara:strand:- start:370 stop:588 length:219 start_codon:yes stop_codon:yes gene_type:complete